MSLSWRTNISVAQDDISLLKLNEEGLTKTMTKVMKQLTRKHKSTAMLLQRIHTRDSYCLKIFGYQLAEHTVSNVRGTTTFVSNGVQ